MLTAFFQLCLSDPQARVLTYPEIPFYYKWDSKRWQRRKQHRRIISRMYNVSPLEKERFALRLLLLHVKGPTSFESLYVDNMNVTHDTYHDCARARGLLDDNHEWRNALEEASSFSMPSAVRVLFAIICTICNASDCLELWTEFQDALCEDFSGRNDAHTSRQLALRHIYRLYNSITGAGSFSSLNLPLQSDVVIHRGFSEQEIQDSLSVVDSRVLSLNEQQRSAFESIIHAVRAENSLPVPKLFYIDGPGGSGKTYLYNTILHHLRSTNTIFTAVAWTGIAAMLLLGGRTSHITFRLPLRMDETTTLNIKRDSHAWLHLTESKLVVWDEISLVPKYALDAVDKLLREITNDPRPFGNKTVVLGEIFASAYPLFPTDIDLRSSNYPQNDHVLGTSSAD